ncbi:MAG: MCE family protein [Actinomycetota bacterium]
MRATSVKLAVFAVVLSVLTASLFLVFSQYRGGSTNTYTAVFSDASRLRSGDSVRVAGVRVGTVDDVTLNRDQSVVVSFDADRKVVLTTGTRASIRYLNLVGDRYLELSDAPGSTRVIPPGGQIPLDRTAPALDLDLLLGGLKPVIQGLNPRDVNALTGALIEVFQGQSDTVGSIFSRLSSFTDELAGNSATIEQTISRLNIVVGTLTRQKGQFSGAVDRLQQLIGELSAQRDPIGDSIAALDQGTASIADLLSQARPPLKGTVDQLNRLAPLLDSDKGRIDGALQKAPNNYRKLVRLGAYGSFVNYYICAIAVRVSDLEGRTAVFPWIRQENGRCADG